MVSGSFSPGSTRPSTDSSRDIARRSSVFRELRSAYRRNRRATRSAADFVYPPVTKSLAEFLADQAPRARVVKAFNTTGQEVFELCPDAIRPYRLSVFVAGDHESARSAVLGLADQIGFVPVDCGPLIHARLLEGAADFIRFLMINRNLAGANYSLTNVRAAPEPKLGGRQQSKLG